MGRTSIEWTERSHNPGIYGCHAVSPACEHCYAASMAHRLSASGVYPPGITRARGSGRGVGWTGQVTTAAHPRMDGLPKTKRARVFVTSMADVFHEDVPDEFLALLFEEMRVRPHLEFLVLTKRAERMADWAHASACERYVIDGPTHRHWYWPDNVWAGVTVEDQRRADERVPHLLRVRHARRFVSCEPLLGPVDLTTIPREYEGEMDDFDALDGHWHPTRDGFHAGWVEERIGWVVAGGESGARARPSHPAWFRSLRNQCADTGVPFLFKQWGEWSPSGGRHHRSVVLRPTGTLLGVADTRSLGDGTVRMYRVGKKAAGRLLDGKLHNEIPGFYDEG